MIREYLERKIASFSKMMYQGGPLQNYETTPKFVKAVRLCRDNCRLFFWSLSDDDYVLPHQRLWTFDVLIFPLSATERFLLQLLVCGTVFHRTSLLPPSLSPSSAVVLNHISSHFLIPLSDSSLICTVPAQ